MANMQQWLTADPLIGDGNGSVKVTAAAHSGRLQRTSDINFRTDGDTVVVTRQVIQEARPEFIDLASEQLVDVGKGSGSFSVAVRSNSAGISLDLDSLPEWLSFSSISVDRVTSKITINQDIPGDPGASAEYTATLKFNYTANTTVSSRTADFAIEAKGQGHSVDVTVRQAAGDATLSVSPESVTLGYDGSEEGTFNVTSNTDWMVD